MEKACNADEKGKWGGGDGDGEDGKEGENYRYHVGVYI